jgi:hypothetical protein
MFYDLQVVIASPQQSEINWIEKAADGVNSILRLTITNHSKNFFFLSMVMRVTLDA